VAGWRKWFDNLIGFQAAPQKFSEKSTIIENIPPSYRPPMIPLQEISQFVGATTINSHSCFAAGTLVQTISGRQPIETLSIGDQVLSQDARTGELSYKPVIEVYHNPPNATFRIQLGNETIVSSQIHRFWKAGEGWVMARDLRAGDRLRTLNGIETVASISNGDVVPVFNLSVADNADFFVGKTSVLAHDNSIPGLRERPFDALDDPKTAEAEPDAAEPGPASSNNAKPTASRTNAQPLAKAGRSGFNSTR
jgi:hypothetical protein